MYVLKILIFLFFAVCTEDHGRLFERGPQGPISRGHRDNEDVQGPFPKLDGPCHPAADPQGHIATHLHH